MNLRRFFVPNSKVPFARKLIVKKLVSFILATLAVSFATLNTARDVPSAIIERDDASPLRLGLSRQRPAFRKALSMLAEAAQDNERLADYYERVTRRVKGDGDEGEENVGAGVITTVRKSNLKRPSVTNIRPSEVSVAASHVQGLMPVAQAAAIADPASSEAYSTEGASQFSAESEPSSPAQLTVGDVAFDTNLAIETWMNYYAATPVGRSTLRIGIERSNTYLEMARAEFRSAGVPEDLVWLAFVESAWNPRAVSPAAAGGMWQFIPATATEYGLKVQSGNDERADPFKQTRVAAAYLRDLYTIFGDWNLAMAAYNRGEPGVMGAIIRNGNADFWEMYDKRLLPKETCNYIPKILATIKLASQAEVYGFTVQAETPGFSAG